MNIEPEDGVLLCAPLQRRNLDLQLVLWLRWPLRLLVLLGLLLALWALLLSLSLVMLFWGQVALLAVPLLLLLLMLLLLLLLVVRIVLSTTGSRRLRYTVGIRRRLRAARRSGPAIVCSIARACTKPAAVVAAVVTAQEIAAVAATQTTAGGGKGPLVGRLGGIARAEAAAATGALGLPG